MRITAAILLLAVFANAEWLYGQQTHDPSPTLRLKLSTVFETAYGSEGNFLKYFKTATPRNFLSDVSLALKIALDSAFQDLGSSVIVEISDSDSGLVSGFKDSTFALQSTILVDHEKSFFIGLTVTNPKSQEKVFSLPLKRVLPASIGEYVNPAQLLQLMAGYLVGSMKAEVTRWLINSSIRFSVSIGTFAQIGNDDGHKYLEDLIPKITVSELTKSAAIWVQAPRQTTALMDTLGKGLPANYTIDGSFLTKNNQLLIEIRCIKRSSNRILTSESSLVDQDVGNLKKITAVVTEMTTKIRRAMESDFVRSTKSLAVVPNSRSKLNSSTRSNARVMDVANEIARVLVQKLRQLTILPSNETGKLNLEIFERDATSDSTPAEYQKPSEILAELDADYLLLVDYEDLGESVRLSSSLHSFDPERPAVAIPVYEEVFDKTQINSVVNSTLLQLVRILCHLGLGSGAGDCDSVSLRGDLTDNKTGDAAVLGILLDKQFGLRIGGVASRADSKLFFGRESGTYLEAFYSRMLHSLSPGLKGGILDVGIEAIFGLDLGGGNFALTGPDVANIFLNLKLYLTSWQFSNTGVNCALGAGAGFQAIRYNFSPGDPRLMVTQDYRESKFVFAGNLFLEVEFPLWREFSFDFLFRHVPASGTITTFRNAPLKEGIAPVGNIGGSYLVGGVKYLFH